MSNSKLCCKNLFKALDNDHINCLKSMLEKGYNPNIKNFIQATPLFLAFMKDNMEDYIELLLNYGADPNNIVSDNFKINKWVPLIIHLCFKDVDHKNILSLLTLLEKSKYIDLLLEYGAVFDSDILLYVIDANTLNVFKNYDFDLDGYIDPSTDKYVSFVKIFIRAKKYELLEMFLKAGLTVNKSSWRYSIKLCDETSLNIFLKYNADKTKMCKHAIDNQNKKFVEILVKSGSDVNLIHYTFNQMYSIDDKLDIIKILVDGGADIDELDYDNMTIFHKMVCNKIIPPVKLFDLKPSIINPVTKINILCESFYQKINIVEAILKNIKDPLDDIWNIMFDFRDFDIGYYESLFRLICEYVDINETIINIDSHKVYPLYCAVCQQNWIATRILLEKDVDTNMLNIYAEDDIEETVLHLAIRQKNKNLVKMLLDKGADKTIKNKQGVNFPILDLDDLPDFD